MPNLKARETGNPLALAFERASAAEVDAAYERYAQLRDPNGVPVDLFASSG